MGNFSKMILHRKGDPSDGIPDYMISESESVEGWENIHTIEGWAEVCTNYDELTSVDFIGKDFKYCRDKIKEIAVSEAMKLIDNEPPTAPITEEGAFELLPHYRTVLAKFNVGSQAQHVNHFNSIETVAKLQVLYASKVHDSFKYRLAYAVAFGSALIPEHYHLINARVGHLINDYLIKHIAGRVAGDKSTGLCDYINSTEGTEFEFLGLAQEVWGVEDEVLENFKEKMLDILLHGNY